MMDKKTRYQLVEVVSKNRKAADAIKSLSQSEEVRKKKPKLIITDGLPAYKAAFKLSFAIRDIPQDTLSNPVLVRMQ